MATPERTAIAKRLAGENPDRDKRLRYMLDAVSNPDWAFRFSKHLSEPRRSRIFRRPVKTLDPEHVERLAIRLLHHEIDGAVTARKQENRSQARRDALKGALSFLGIR